MPVRRLSYQAIARLACTWLDEYHPTMQPPTPIEEIIDLRYRINIVPLPGILNSVGVDGFLAVDRSINVDEIVSEQYENRFRFTLAHELAHIILHGDLIEEIAPKSVEDARQRRQVMASRGRDEWTDEDWAEWQARQWAGLVLVPPQPLATAFQGEYEKYQRKIAAAYDAGLVNDDPMLAYDYVCEPLAKLFIVSAEVMAIRIDKDGLLPPRPRS